MGILNSLEGDLFSPSSTLNRMEKAQNRVLEETAHLHGETPDYPETYWGGLPHGVGGVQIDKYGPSGIEKEIVYNPLLMFASLFDPTILREVAEHEGIHGGTPGKLLLSYLYYDFRDGYIKFGKIEPEATPNFKYPVGKGIIEGGVKVTSEKIGGVKQKAYPVSSEMVEEIDKKLAEIDNNYSLIYIQKLAGIAQKKLIQKYFSKFVSNPDDLKIKEMPKELNELLYILNKPKIIGIVRKYAPKTDLFYVI